MVQGKGKRNEPAENVYGLERKCTKRKGMQRQFSGGGQSANAVSDDRTASCRLAFFNRSPFGCFPLFLRPIKKYGSDQNPDLFLPSPLLVDVFAGAGSRI